MFCEICPEYLCGLPSRFSGATQERGRVRSRERQWKEERWGKPERTEKLTESRKIQLRAASAVELLTSLVVVHVWPRPSIEEAEERQSEQQAGKTRWPQVDFHTLLRRQLRSACWTCRSTMSVLIATQLIDTSTSSRKVRHCVRSVYFSHSINIRNKIRSQKFFWVPQNKRVLFIYF